MTMRSLARSERLSTKRLTSRSPTKIARKQSVARNSGDALRPSSSHSAENLTPLVLRYRPPLVLPRRIRAGSLIGEEPIPQLAAFITVPDLSGKSVAPILAIEISARYGGAHPARRPVAISLRDQGTDSRYIPRAPPWLGQTEPGASVLVLPAADICALRGDSVQIVGNTTITPAAWTRRHANPYPAFAPGHDPVGLPAGGKCAGAALVNPLARCSAILAQSMARPGRGFGSRNAAGRSGREAEGGPDRHGGRRLRRRQSAYSSRRKLNRRSTSRSV